MRRPPGHPSMKLNKRVTLLSFSIAILLMWGLYKSSGGRAVSGGHSRHQPSSLQPVHAGQGGAVPKVSTPIWWYAPFLDHSSFGVEALDFITTLVNQRVTEESATKISLLQMQCTDEVKDTMPPQHHQLLMRLKATQLQAPAIVLCHNMPKFFGLPSPEWASCEPCPAPNYKPAYTVARAMSETSRIPADFVKACNSLDEVWVPCEYSKQALIRSGVTASKVYIVPPVVNTQFFNPSLHQAVAQPESVLPFTKVYGLRRGAQDQQHVFKFVSVFKWEARKGWEALLSAYLSEFTWSDHVALYIRTQPFDQVTDMKEEIMQWVSKHLSNRAVNMPHLYVCTNHLSNEQYAQLLASSDAFVLPTRGDGWGLPVVEAMSMALPVLATQYSGIAAYLDSAVGYPVPYKEVDVPDDVKQPWFKGSKWAEPDVGKLKQLMRHVTRNAEEAKRRGAAARERMIDWYSPEVMAIKLGHEFKRIERALAARASSVTKQATLDASSARR